MNKPHIPKSTVAFCAVLALDFLYSLYNFFLVLREGDVTAGTALSWLALFALNALPLIMLIVVSKKIPHITEQKTLSRVRTILLVYFLLDILSNLLPTGVPRIFRMPFYSSGTFFCMKYIFGYKFFNLVPSLALRVGYWAAFGCLLFEIRSQMNSLQNGENAENSETADAKIAESGAGKKLAASFKIAIASIILFVLQSAFDCVLLQFLGNEISGTVGMQAIGTAVLYFLALALRAAYSLPLTVLAIVGIVKGVRAKNAPFRRLKCGIRINAVLLALSALGMALFFFPDLWI